MKALNVRANESPEVDISSWKSSMGPYDCEVDALPHDHGHHINTTVVFLVIWIQVLLLSSFTPKIPELKTPVD